MRRHKIIHVLTVCLFMGTFLVIPAWAETPTADPVAAETEISPNRWQTVPAESSIRFSGTQMGASFSGSFASFTADIVFDPAAPEAATITATIDIASAQSGDKERDSTLKGPEFFDTARFATARFESSRLRKTGDDAFEAEGTLTIRDISLPVILPFTLEISADDSGKETAKAAGSVTLDRSKFKLGQGDWEDPGVIANDVTVDVRLTATRQKPASDAP